MDRWEQLKKRQFEFNCKEKPDVLFYFSFQELWDYSFFINKQKLQLSFKKNLFFPSISDKLLSLSLLFIIRILKLIVIFFFSS